MALTHHQITDRLEAIEADLGNRQNDFADAAERYHKLIRDYELRMARAVVASTAGTATEKKAEALVALAASNDSLYEDLKVAEGAYEGCKAAVRVLEQRAMVGMSLLKSQGREPFVEAPASRTFAGTRG